MSLAVSGATGRVSLAGTRMRRASEHGVRSGIECMRKKKRREAPSRIEQGVWECVSASAQQRSS
jgi:hypothetical protein